MAYPQMTMSTFRSRDEKLGMPTVATRSQWNIPFFAMFWMSSELVVPLHLQAMIIA
jgi:hypothetical protein